MGRLFSLLLLLGVSLLMTGCIAEFLAEGVAVEGLAEVGSLEAGAAAVAVEEAEATGAIASRVASGELAVDSGAFRSVLAELADGSAGRTLDLDSSGTFYRAGRALAQVGEDGAITVERAFGRKALVGRVAAGRLWTVDAQGALRQAIGELRGFVPGAGVELYDHPFSSETTFRVLDPHSLVEVLERRGGWIEVRLVSGSKGWVWSPLVAVTALLGPHGNRRPRDLEQSLQPGGEERCVELSSGQLIRGQVVDRASSATRLATNADEQVEIDDAAVASAELCRDAQNLDWTAGSYTVALQTGAILYARSYEIVGGAAVLTLGDGSRIFVSRDLLTGAPVPPRALEESAPQVEPRPTFASLPAMERSVSFRLPRSEARTGLVAQGPAAPSGAEGWRRFQGASRIELAGESGSAGLHEAGRSETGGFWGPESTRPERPGPRFDGSPRPEPALEASRTRDERRPEERQDSGRTTRERDEAEPLRDGRGDRWARPVETPAHDDFSRNPRSPGERREVVDPRQEDRPRWQRPEPRPPSSDRSWSRRPDQRPAPPPRPRSRPPQRRGRP